MFAPATVPNDPFAEEHAALDLRRAELLSRWQDHYVVFSGSEFLGAEPTYAEAFELGLQRVGTGRMMIERLTREPIRLAVASILIAG